VRSDDDEDEQLGESNDEDLTAKKGLMSQQAAAGRGAPMAGRGGGLKTRQLKFHPRAGELTKPKGYKSAISEIATDTFNTGQNKFAAQFTQSRKNVANYLQQTLANEGY
jgi:hypothetical protein